MKSKKKVDRSHDKYDLSPGNIEVLKAIPEMMSDPRFRKELRELTIKWMYFRNSYVRLYPQYLKQSAVRDLKKYFNKKWKIKAKVMKGGH